MNQKRTSLEVIAINVEEAIAKGLADLGVSRERVEIEILDGGSGGLFGLGARQARIRLTIKEEPRVEPEVIEETQSEVEEEPIPQEPAAPKPAMSRYEEVQQEVTLDICQATVLDLLEHMGIECQVSAEYGEADEINGIEPVIVNIRGDDLSILIGKRAETLNALQYIARLIVSKELGRSVTMIVDVEGYRTRREHQLRLLARRMADQAIKTGRKQVLEPMNPAERRIIHIELRDSPYVTTQSFGEEPHRKVNILPKD